MSDKFETLLETLKEAEPPKGGAGYIAAKESSIFKALEKFDEKHALSSQGNTNRSRPMNTAFAGINHWIRNLTMRKTYIAAGSLCLGVLAIGLIQLQPEFIPTQKPKDSQLEILKQDAKGIASTDTMIAADASKKTESLPEAVEVNKAELESPAFAAPPVISTPPAYNTVQMGNAKLAGASLGAIATPEARFRSVDAAALHSKVIFPDGITVTDVESEDKFSNKDTNAVKLVKEQPVSTFSIDVDTASYSFMRSALNSGAFPDKDQIRVEELINYFPYDYAPATSKEKPFKANVSVYPSPWNKNTKLMHIGIKGYEMKQTEKPHSNLVFLIDTSGSMNEPNKLPLLVNSFKLMLQNLKEDDRIAIVTYAGSAGTVLEPTLVKDKAKIIAALDQLGAGGSTAGAEGIRQAYALAEQHKEKEGINRVILATDGDFNVGISEPEELKKFIEQKRKSGVFLSVLGFGRGNYNDALMQALAQNGNGNAAYIDTLNEAQKVLVEEAGSTLFPIAKDVKIQVEFNPAKIAEYRLIGYETRMLNREDFNNDKIDAGDIGAGHTVTAIYELAPVGSDAKLVDDLRYTSSQNIKSEESSDEYAHVKIRYKLPESDVSTLISTPIDAKAEYDDLTKVPSDVQFATAVAAFGQKLRGAEYIGNYQYDDVIAAAQASKGADPFGYRSEFVNLVRLAKSADPAK